MNLKRYTEGGETARRQCFFCASSRASFSRFTLTPPKRSGGYYSSPPAHAGNLALDIKTALPASQSNANIISHHTHKKQGGFWICVKGRISVIHANILRIGNNIDNFEEKHGLTRPRILSICFPHEGFGITVESRLDLVSTIGNPPYWAAAAAQLFTPQALAQLGYAFHCIQHVADARIIPVKRRIGHNGTASLQTRCAKPSE